MAASDDTSQGYLPHLSLPRKEYVLRAEKHHDEFLTGNAAADWVMLKLNTAKTLADDGITAEEYGGPGISVITTTTGLDSWIKNLDDTDERDILRDFQPDAHVPGDHPTYNNHESGRRTRNVMECMEITLYLYEELGHQIAFIPLIKGEEQWERQICYDVLEEIGIDYCAVYTKQHFGPGAGYQKTKLVQDLQDVAASTSVDEILTIGLQSTNLLKLAPPQVVATAGKGWIWETEYRNRSRQKAIRRLGETSTAIEAELGHGQMSLGMYADQSVQGGVADGR